MNVNYSNLKTVVINLDDYINNYNKQLPYLENLGLKVERFKGINANKNEHLNPIYGNYISNFALNCQPKSVIGCSLSHLFSAKYMYDNYLNDYDYFLIMEDDAFPSYNKEDFYTLLNKNLNEIQILDHDWDIIQLHSDAIFPNLETYNTHYACGSAAAYLISKKGLKKSLDLKVYGYSDFIQHNFLKFNKYRVKSNLFWTDEKYSVNRVMDTKKDFYHLSLSIKSNFIEFINKFILSIPLRGEKTYSHFLEFPILKLPYMIKEYTANEVIDYLLGLIMYKKLRRRLS